MGTMDLLEVSFRDEARYKGDNETEDVMLTISDVDTQKAQTRHTELMVRFFKGVLDMALTQGYALFIDHSDHPRFNGFLESAREWTRVLVTIQEKCARIEQTMEVYKFGSIDTNR